MLLVRQPQWLDVVAQAYALSVPNKLLHVLLSQSFLTLLCTEKKVTRPVRGILDLCEWRADMGQHPVEGLRDPENVNEELDLDKVSPQEKARLLVFAYIKTMLDKSDPNFGFKQEEVSLVWFCKTLQNWKALVTTTLPDQMYYEVTYNGDRNETYLDAYKKFHNVCIPD